MYRFYYIWYLTQSSRIGTAILRTRINTKMSREPMTDPIRSFFAFSPEFCSSALENFTLRKMQQMVLTATTMAIAGQSMAPISPVSAG